MIGRPLDNVPLLSAIAEKALSSECADGLAFVHRDRRLEARYQLCAHSRNAIAPDRQHRRGQGDGRDQPRDPHRLSAAGLRLPVRAARRADRRREADHQSDRGHDRHGQAVRRGRLVGPRRAQQPAVRIHAAGARLQCDGRPAQPARARTGRHQRPSHRDGLDRHAVGSCQPPRLPEPARFRMDEGAAISTANCRC